MTSIVWGVKASLLEYLADLGDATTTCSGGAEALGDGRFRWPAETVPDGFRGSGTVRFEAYGGMLDVRLDAPTVHGDGDRVRVEVLRAGAPVEIATGTVASDGPFRAALVITGPGSRLLGDVYPPGTALDELTVED